MSSSDPIRAALAEIDASGETDDPGDLALDEDPDPDPDRDLDDRDSDETGGGFSLFDWARRVPEGSHLDFDARDWWDPDTGGKNRLAFHLSDATGDGLGYPNGPGVLVALGEMYWAEVKGSGSSSDDDGGDDRADRGDGADEIETFTVEDL